MSQVSKSRFFHILTKQRIRFAADRGNVGSVLSLLSDAAGTRHTA